MLTTRSSKTALLALFTIAFFTPVLLAQGGPGHDGHGEARLWRDGGGPYFDPATVVTVSGVLDSTVAEWPPWGHGNHTGGGTHATLSADDGTSYELMLAPVPRRERSLPRRRRPATVTGSLVEPYGEHPWSRHGGPGVGGFVAGASDALRTIEFVHNYAVPEYLPFELP